MDPKRQHAEDGDEARDRARGEAASARDTTTTGRALLWGGRLLRHDVRIDAGPEVVLN
jgi:hypothetical protein